MPSGHRVQCLLQLGRLPAADDMQGQEDPHYQPQDRRRRVRGVVSRGLQSHQGHIPEARPRLHHRLLENVREAVQFADAGRPERAHRHGRTGHVQRRHVPALRS